VPRLSSGHRLATAHADLGQRRINMPAAQGFAVLAWPPRHGHQEQVVDLRAHVFVLSSVYGETNEFDEKSIKSTGYVNNKGD
jgi:hypothetical protein